MMAQWQDTGLVAVMMWIQLLDTALYQDRAFPVAASRAWNSLPADVRDAPSLLTFRRRLKDVFVSLFIWLTLIASL